MITLHIAEDQNIIISGIKSILQNDIQVVGITNNGEETIEWFKTNKADVLLLDISMPKKNGIEVLQEFKENNNNQKTVVFSGYKSDLFVDKCFEYGALGYLLKDSDTYEINTAVRKAFKNKGHVSNEIFEILLEIEDRKENYKSLSKREKEVLHLLYDNMEFKQVQEKLSIKPSTFGTLTQRIRRKLNIKNNAGIAKYFNIIN